jgi:hypothetical protein
MAINNIAKKTSITITRHAQQRIIERAPHIPQKQHLDFSYNARYKGIPDNHFCGEFKNWLACAYRQNNSTQIRVYKNYVFVFSGNNHKSRTLVTVIPVKEQYKDNYQNFIQERFQVCAV